MTAIPFHVSRPPAPSNFVSYFLWSATIKWSFLELCVKQENIGPELGPYSALKSFLKGVCDSYVWHSETWVITQQQCPGWLRFVGVWFLTCREGPFGIISSKHSSPYEFCPRIRTWNKCILKKHRILSKYCRFKKVHNFVYEVFFKKKKRTWILTYFSLVGWRNYHRLKEIQKLNQLNAVWTLSEI